MATKIPFQAARMSMKNIRARHNLDAKIKPVSFDPDSFENAKWDFLTITARLSRLSTDSRASVNPSRSRKRARISKYKGPFQSPSKKQKR